MNKNDLQKIKEEEFELLRSELKRIDTKIKVLSYEKNLDKQGKLWELRERVKANLDKFIKEYPALFQ